MQNPLALTVIIPVLNEAEALPGLLDQLRSQADVVLDIIVADGGSTDGSVDIAARRAVRLVQTQRGRARQLNQGAALAQQEQLLFLHADSTLKDTHLLANALRNWWACRKLSGNSEIAGHFRICFDKGGDKHARAFNYLEEKSASNRPQTINGDQGLLIDKQFFQRLGGYDERLQVMEDQKIAQQIFEAGEWMLLPGTLFTSARRFEIEGFHRRYLLMGLMMAFYWSGTPEFFARASDVYPSQRDAKKLRLWPFFRAIWLVLLKDLGPRRSSVQIYRIARYIRQNAWQFFFFLDVNRRPISAKRNTHSFTRFHDRFIHPLINNRLADMLVIPFAAVWFLLILGPVFYLLDRR